MNNRGKFITFEGIEGVGKSSNMAFAARCLQESGKKTYVTREPGGTPAAEDIRKVLLSHYDEKILPLTELLLVFAGRLQHVENVIKPALIKGEWVLCDRFYDATYAYQGGGRGVNIAEIDAMREMTLQDFAPDATILLDADVATALERTKDRQADRFEREKADFFQRIRDHYLLLAKQNSERIFVVNAQQSLPAVQSAIAQILQTLV